MQTRALAFTSLLLAGSLSAQVIYDNGPLVTSATGGFGGGPVSVLQTAAPQSLTIFGFNAQIGLFNIADDFAVNGVMVITDIEFFCYLTGNAAPVVTAVNLGVYGGGPPSTTGTLVTNSPPWGTNLVGLTGYTVTTTPTGIYRALDTTPTANTRLIQAVKVTLPAPITLTTGVYWLRFAYTGPTFTPPITVLGETVTGNALQNTVAGNTWATMLDVTSVQGAPFRLYGTSATPAGSITDAGLPSCGSTTIEVLGAPVLGGFIRTNLGGVTGLGLIGYGFSHTPTGFCGCVAGHEWASVVVSNTATLQIPMNTAFAGFSLRMQGADLGGVGGCPNPMVTFTSTRQLNLQ